MARDGAMSAVPAMSLLSLRIEAAILTDHVLRLQAERRSPWSRMRARLDASASALRGLIKRPRRNNERQQDTERCSIVLLKSGLFDEEYYLRRNPDVATAEFDPVVHYLRHGAAEGRDPGPHFSTQDYIRRYPAVAKSGINPLYHFIVQGYASGFWGIRHSLAERAAVDPGSARGVSDRAVGSAPGSVWKNQRLVVYTALFGDYDDLFMPTLQQAERCDFVVFTDRPDVPPPWRRGDVCYAAANRFKQNRFYKLLPHRLFPDHEWSLYLDGNVDLRANPLEFLDHHAGGGADFLVFRHPRRTSILEELAACIEMRKDDAELMVRQVGEYLESGFRHAFALTENNIMLRRHNDPALVALSEGWWDEVRCKSQRDQLSLSYVVEKSAYPGIALFDGGLTIARQCPDLRLRPHRAHLYARDPLHDAAV